MQFFKATKVGLLKTSLRLKVGKKLRGKTNPRNIYMFAEFEETEDENQLANVLKITKKGQMHFTSKAHMAGTNTFVYVHKSQRK
mmetsp:Transcript_13731/g.23417  ORF Transcript_13731/g.23417 Transcript_13731/m.23417 type:complete len:84 (+) Transcript_13731:110-361(+)